MLRDRNVHSQISMHECGFQLKTKHAHSAHYSVLLTTMHAIIRIPYQAFEWTF